jgi:hypothetical protein
MVGRPVTHRDRRALADSVNCRAAEPSLGASRPPHPGGHVTAGCGDRPVPAQPHRRGPGPYPDSDELFREGRDRAI